MPYVFTQGNEEWRRWSAEETERRHQQWLAQKERERRAVDDIALQMEAEAEVEALLCRS